MRRVDGIAPKKESPIADEYTSSMSSVNLAPIGMDGGAGDVRRRETKDVRPTTASLGITAVE
jgi:hypothetical protein